MTRFAERKEASMREKRPQNAVTATQLRCQSTIMSSVTSCVVMSSAVETAIPAGRKQRRGGLACTA